MPAPDGRTTELIKWLDEGNRQRLLEIFNEIIEFDESSGITYTRKHSITLSERRRKNDQLQTHRPMTVAGFIQAASSTSQKRLAATYDPWPQ